MKPYIAKTIAFRDKEISLVYWAEAQAKKKYLKLNNFNTVVKECMEIVREKGLLTEK